MNCATPWRALPFDRFSACIVSPRVPNEHCQNTYLHVIHFHERKNEYASRMDWQNEFCTNLPEMFKSQKKMPSCIEMTKTNSMNWDNHIIIPTTYKKWSTARRHGALCIWCKLFHLYSQIALRIRKNIYDAKRSTRVPQNEHGTYGMPTINWSKCPDANKMILS